MTVTLASPILTFDDWAKARSWDARCDRDLRFESPKLVEALATWRAHTGPEGIPMRSQLTARILKPCLGRVVIFERTAPSLYRVRLMGTRITEVLGDMQGKMLEEAVPDDVRMRWTGGLDAVLGRGGPLRFVSRLAFQALDYLQAEILAAPLLDETREMNMVFTVTVFRNGVAPGATLKHVLEQDAP